MQSVLGWMRGRGIHRRSDALKILFKEDKVDRSHEAKASSDVVPVEGLAFEEKGSDYGEDDERDDLLYYLELDKAEGTAVTYKPETIGRHLAHIFKQGNSPRE